ncbi:MAG: MerR family transcriptional regulator [Acidobacteriota bacterium]|nr:MerR family transcriptional regulator [Acidobacteriota bacterium]
MRSTPGIPDRCRPFTPATDGHKRLYVPRQVLEISLIAELRRKGFSLQKIRRVLRYLKTELGKRLSEGLMAIPRCTWSPMATRFTSRRTRTASSICSPRASRCFWSV